MIEIVQARVEHAEQILPHLRTHDKKTIERFGIDALALLRATIERGSPSFTGLVDRAPACMWGLENNSLIGGFQKLWFITTPLIEGHKIRFLRENRAFLAWARGAYGPIEACVDPSYELSVRWLKWLGFKPISGEEILLMRTD